MNKLPKGRIRKKEDGQKQRWERKKSLKWLELSENLHHLWNIFIDVRDGISQRFNEA